MESASEGDEGAPNSNSSNSSTPKSHFKSQEDQQLIRLALHKSPFFTCLDEEQIERFVRTARKERFAPGTIVILEGCVDDREESNESVSSPTSRTTATHKVEAEHERLSGTLAAANTSDEYFDRTSHQLDPEVEEDPPSSSSGEASSAGQEPGLDATDPAATLPTPTFVSDPPTTDGPEETKSLSIDSSSSDHSVTAQHGETGSLEEDLDGPLMHDTAGPSDQEERDPPWRHPLSNVPSHFVPAPQSGKVRSLYIVQKGKADVWYQQSSPDGQRPNFVRPASMGPGTLFGEGGFLFGRQHSASVVASEAALECWVVDLPTFREYVLLSDNMKALFHHHADPVEGTMTLDDFMHSCTEESMESSDFLVSSEDPWARSRVANTLQLLSGSARPALGRISLPDFCWFYFLLARPDPEVDIAFLLMDQTQSGQVGLEQVAALVDPVFPGTDYTADFFQRYFGRHGQDALRLPHFSQFFADLHQELGRQVFCRAAATKGGYLPPADFLKVLNMALGWRLPLSVADRLESLYVKGPLEAGEAAARVSLMTGSLNQETTAATAERAKASVLAEMEQSKRGYGDRAFVYADFLAFQEVITNLPGICNLIDRAQEIKKEPVSPDDFKVAHRVLGLGGRLSRRQVDIVFALFDLDKDGYISHEDTISVCGVDFARRLVAVEGRHGKLTFAPPPEFRPTVDEEASPSTSVTVSQLTARGLEYFGLTACAGALGAVALYPVDLVKTRLMNQRMELNGKRMYTGFMDCLRRAVAAEGFLGLYRGLAPQLLGVAPEKMIKLQVNDLLRKALSSNDQESGKPVIKLPLEVMAGAFSGACQLLVTNPMELAKIRMQMEGETSRILAERGWATSKPRGFFDVARGLGFPGIYRGASSCLLRDVFFGALYFPTYAWCKEQLASRNEIPGYATPFDLLAAGTFAGIPAAFITNPLDVIKTRLQTLPRPEEGVYLGIRDCAKSIYLNEGIGGFFLGAGARVLRIAPQFGITLLTYEYLTEAVGSQRRSVTPSPPTNAFIEPYDYRTAFPTRSIHHKTEEISNFMQAFGHGPPQTAVQSGKKDDRK